MQIIITYSSSTEQKAKKIKNNILETLREQLNMSKNQFKNECKFVEDSIGDDSQIKRVIIISLGSLFFINEFTQKIYASGLNSIDSGGDKILKVVYKIGKWLLIINCIAGILKWALQQDPKGKRQALGSIAAYAGMYVVPKIFNFVEEIFIN